MQRMSRFIVYHSFEYTHHHYRVCDSSHVPKECQRCTEFKKKAPLDGECDFIIVLANCIVIIEVKNMKNVVECEPTKKETALNALKETFKKSEKQRKAIVELIQLIDPDMKTMQFTAYPNFSRRYSEQFQVEDAQLATIIFQEDFSEEMAFGNWWRAKVTEQIVETTTSTEPEIINILLAIWADCDESKLSFGKCIIDIDEQLREGLITLVTTKGKHRNKNRNPLVEKSDDIIKKNLGVHYLTKEQKDILDSSENLMWLNGPAGAGKTVIMCGKIIKLMLESDRDSRIMLFRSIAGNGTDLQKTESFYQLALRKACIRFEVINQQQIDSHRAVWDRNIKVIIVDIKDHQRAAKLIDQFSGEFHLFLDDAQKVLYYSTRGGEYGVFIDKLKKMAENKVVWIACDMVQGWRYLGQRYTRELAKNLKETLSDEQRKCLSMNLRNTCDLSNILCVIRDRFILRYDQQGQDRFPVDMILPKQTRGHYIHGTKTVIHVLNNYDLDTIGELLKTELDKLNQTHKPNSQTKLRNQNQKPEVPETSSQAKEVQKVNPLTNLGVVYNSSNSDVESLVKDIVSNHKDKQKIALCDSVFSYSVEWPAVIVLHQMWGDLDNDLPALYLAMSRARVHCFLMLYPDEGETTKDHNEEMLELVEELKDHAHVRYIFDEDDS